MNTFNCLKLIITSSCSSLLINVQPTSHYDVYRACDIKKYMWNSYHLSLYTSSPSKLNFIVNSLAKWSIDEILNKDSYTQTLSNWKASLAIFCQYFGNISSANNGRRRLCNRDWRRQMTIFSKKCLWTFWNI
jgi:hypothetical protein